MAKTMASLQAFPSSLLPPPSRVLSCSNSLPLPFQTSATLATARNAWDHDDDLGPTHGKKKRLHFLCLAAKASETKNTSP